MIRFIYHAGSEATKERLKDYIREDLQAGHKVIVLVPEQETVSVERRMLEQLPPSAQLSFEVLNFSRLANRTFRVLGGLSYRAATPAVSALFMWQALSETSVLLRQYGTAARKDDSLCDLMLATAAQCKAACITPEALLNAAEQLPKGEPLRDKLYDVGLILSTFDLRLGERFENSADDLTRLGELLTREGKALFADTHVYVDSFTDFTRQEQDVLKALFAAAPTVSVTFPLESRRTEKGLHLTSVLRTHKKLFAIAKELGQSVYFENETAERPADAIGYLSRHLFDMQASPAPLGMADSGQLSLCECDSPFEEATAIANRIHSLVRAGCHYRDITVVVRDATVWNGILDDALEREGIPCFISEKSDITLHPLIKLITEALRIKLRNWRPEDVVGYLKTDLCGISSDDVNLFEEYVNVWSPKGEKAYISGSFTKNPDGYKATVSPRGMRILEGANRVRKAMIAPLIKLFAALDAAEDTTGLCAAIYEFLNILDIREKLKLQAKERILAGERREAEELSRLYNVTVDALEALSTAMGDKHLSVAELANALKLVFSRTDIGSIPTSADEVTIGSASMLRTDHPRFVLVAGLNDGIFPATVSNDGLFGDTDRRRLTELGVEFPTDSEKMVSDEMFYLYRAMSAPREGLFLYYSLHGTDGRALSPSIAVNRVKALFPTLKRRIYGAGDPMDGIYTPAGAMERLTELPPKNAELMLRLLEQQKLNTAASLRRPVVDMNATVAPETAQKLFGTGGFSPTQLESFAQCRFKYYCQSILRLREENSDSLTSADTGNFIHHVLEQALLTVQKEKKPFSAYGEAEQTQLVKDICARYRQDVLGARGELLPRSDALLDRLTTLSELVVSGVFSELNDSLFTPAFLELSLSELSQGKPAVSQDDTNTRYSLDFSKAEDTEPAEKPLSVPLTGRIDRVDYWQAPDGRVYLRVTDYKTGSKSFKLEDIEKGFCMQMPLYLLALCRGRHNALCKKLGLPPNTPFLPAGVTYLSSNISVEKTESRKDEQEAMRDAVKRLTREGVLLDEPDVLEAMSRSGDTAIVGSKRTKARTPLSAEGFDELFHTLEGSISRLTTDMRSGSAKVRPTSQGGASPCDYCGYIAICRAAKKSKE